MEIREFAVPDGGGGRADVLLAAFLGVSRSSAARLCEDGCAVRGEKILNKKDILLPGMRVKVTLNDPENPEILPENIPLDIVYEDDCLLVVNKPKGMVVHPAPGNYGGTLVNALLYRCGDGLSGINGVARPGILHRIDKDTSGLLLVAKNDFAHRELAKQIAAHSFTRVYEAVVYGIVANDSGEINAPIGRHPVKRKQMAVTEKNSKPAVTRYTVIKRYAKFTHVALKLETGRTHQIRVHMAYIGHPVAGDPVYGPKKCIAGLRGQCLHAKTIGFVHPQTGRYMEFDSPLPDYFTKFLREIGDRSDGIV